MPLLYLGHDDGHDLYIDTRTGSVIIDGPDGRDEITKTMIRKYIKNNVQQDEKQGE